MARIMALDVGDKRVGVAVSDETGLIPEPKAPIQRSHRAADVEAVRALCDTWDVSCVVVGLPLNMNGTRGPQAEKVLKFVQYLEPGLRCPVVTWDERLTTKEAERRLVELDMTRTRRRQVVDGVAAALILEGYLHRQRMLRERSETMSDKDDERFETDEDEIITLTDDDGEDHEFVVVDVIEVASKEYAILLPYETADEEEAEAVILRIEKAQDGEDQLVEIEDEKEWQAVVDAYEAVLEADDDADQD